MPSRQKLQQILSFRVQINQPDFDRVVKNKSIQSYLHMVAWKRRCSKGFLCLVHQLSSGCTQYKSSLITSGCCRSYSKSLLPPSMDTFTRIKKIQFYYLHYIVEKQRIIKLISNNKCTMHTSFLQTGIYISCTVS